jgi:putative tryptophan/tyrosine transport system substrate-binding protein
MKRRTFITLLGGAAAAWPLAARAQQPERMRRIGVLMGLREDDLETKSRLAKLRQELERLGWSEGSNLHMDIRFAPSGEQGSALAKELVALRPEMILAHTAQVTGALQRETRVIPIVFVNVSDPIGAGFVSNLARPSGNLTGLLQYEEGIIGKWLSFLRK